MSRTNLPRTLITVPIVHTEADMGDLKDLVRRAKAEKLGGRGWERSRSRVDQLWTKIEQTIEAQGLPYARTRIYQDGLPVCGREIEIVEDLARAGSRNHQLLLRLRDQGAEIMGTESAELLVEEYELARQLLRSKDRGIHAPTKQKERRALSESLLQRRDAFIANRINGTLKADQTGLLFIGMLHSVERWLAQDIHVSYPMDRPSPVTKKRYG